MNYSVEGNIDFYSELLNSMCETTINNEKQENQKQENKILDVCLITQMPLEENFITLDCKHKFNYLPLFNEVKRQKQDSVLIKNLETTRLKINEIKCPYCRTVQPKILPYYIYENAMTYVFGVTFPEKYRMDRIPCPSILKSGKRKGEKCGRLCGEREGNCNIHRKQALKNKGNSSGCCKILKSGKRKGEKCGANVYKNKQCKRKLCKRHYDSLKK